MGSFRELLTLTVKNWLQSHSQDKSCTISEISIRTKNRNFAYGDYVVNYHQTGQKGKPLKLSLLVIPEEEVTLTGYKEVQLRLSATVEKNRQVIKVSRAPVFFSLVQRILQRKTNAVATKEEQRKEVFLHINDRSCETSILHMRTKCVRDLLLALFSSKNCVSPTDPDVWDESQDAANDELLKAAADDELLKAAADDELLKAEDVKEALIKSSFSSQHVTERGDAPLMLSLRAAAEHLKWHLGKQGYDSNVCSEHVKVTEDHLKLLQELEATSARFSSQKISSWIFVCSAHSQHFVQEAMMMWRILHPDTTQQVLISCGPVSARKPKKDCHGHREHVRAAEESVLSAPQLLEKKKEEAKKSYLTKYGNKFSGETFDDMCLKVAQCSVKFELLSTHHASPVHIDFSGSYPDPGGGVFVLYNCSRLFTLFRRFEEQVEKGIYPALPQPSHVDFTLLREEEEWQLCFVFLLNYESLLRDSAASIINTASLRVSFPSHKICQYLFDLSHVISTYYNRIHILGDAKTHLYPLMIARLTLLKAVHLVMIDLLKTLNLEPLQEM